jgi:thioredoxin 1
MLISRFETMISIDMSTVQVSENTFGQLVTDHPIVFLDFWASWCGPCLAMEPVVQKLAAKYSDRVIFGKVNVDEEINLSSKFQVFSIPTFMIFKNGQPMEAVVGAVGESALERLINNVIEARATTVG